MLSAYHCTYNHESGDGSKPCDHSDGDSFFSLSDIIFDFNVFPPSPCLDDDLGKRVAVLGRNDFNYREALIGKYYSIPIIGDIINSTSLKSVDISAYQAYQIIRLSDTSAYQAYQSLYETMQNQSVGERQTIYLIMK